MTLDNFLGSYPGQSGTSFSVDTGMDGSQVMNGVFTQVLLTVGPVSPQAHLLVNYPVPHTQYVGKDILSK